MVRIASLCFALALIEVSMDVLGEAHLVTLKSQGSLAKMYESQGRYGEAGRLGREALERRRAVLGPDHPDTLSSLSNRAAP